MMPNGWNLKLISDTSKVITGNTPSTKIREYYGGNIPFVSPADLGGSKHISVATKKLTVEGFKKARSIRAGSTLFTCIGSTIGKLGMSATEVATNQQINAVVPYDKFDDDFIYYQLELRAVFIAKLAGTQAVPIINKTTFESQSLLVPDSLPEQRKIAKILSTWDKAISTTERLIDNSKQQKKALMQQLLTGAHTQRKRLLDDSGKPFEGEWTKVELGKLLDYKQPTPYLVKSTDYSNEYSIPVLTAGKTFILGYSNENFGIFEEELPAIIFDDFTTASKLVDFPFKAKSSAMKILVANQGVSIKFVYEAMQVLNYPVGGHQRHWISIFANLVIGLPSPPEQQKIASVLSNADKEIELLEQQLADLKQEKKALMQQLLTGKRRVKIDDKEVA